MKGFYNEDELKLLGLNKFGKNVLLSKDVKLFHPEKFSIGDNSRVDAFCFITGDVEIGSHVHIAPFVILSGSNGIKLHDFVGIAARVSIYTSDADYTEGSLTNPTISKDLRNVTTGKVELEKHVLIGAHSVVLPKSVLGEGSTYGSFSLIKGNYEPWFIYKGIPAKKYKSRPKEEILKNEKKVLSSDP